MIDTLIKKLCVYWEFVYLWDSIFSGTNFREFWRLTKLNISQKIFIRNIPARVSTPKVCCYKSTENMI